MPRSKSNHHNMLSNTLPQPQQSHQSSLMYSPQRNDPQVQRSQGVIFLSTNKPQLPVTQPTSTMSANTHLAHQANQVPAHHASMFQPQHVPAFVPPTMMQNPFFPYYHPIPAPVVPAAPSNEMYTLNGGITYDDSMQIPPDPIKNKPIRRSRYTADDSDSSSEAEFNDDDEDPDWNPTGDEVPEPTFENRRGTPRGRRPSSTPRGRGGGTRGRGSRGGGRGRGRGRGRVSDAGIQRSDVPPTLVDQTAHMHSQLGGRQMRSTINMPSLDPQSGQLTFGELVSAAVQSLNDPDEVYGGQHKRKPPMAAVIVTQPNKVILIERVTLSGPASLFVPVNLSQNINDKENKDELALEGEDEDLIMAYEIIQEDDKQRPFMCEICGKESKSRILHNRHLVTHEPNLSFACCICSQLFENHEKLKPHLRIHHGSGIFVCPEVDCEGVFQERKSLDDHDFACHPNARPHTCRFCLDRFPTVADAQAHEEAHDEDITASCLKCGSTYKKKTDLKNHYSHMHEEKQCKFCENKFENQPALDDHLNEMHEEEMKPPSPPPEPSPEPEEVADEDPLPSPIGGNDDDDDIVVVEEHTKSAQIKPMRKSDKKTKRPETVKTPGKPGPKPKPKPVVKSKPMSAASDIITLSSDSEDEKDPDWKIPVSTRSRKSTTSNIPSPSTIKRSTRKKAEYVIIVESRTEETANDVLKKTQSSNQPLTFVLGDSGDLVHVPTSSDPHPPDSLPLKEILDVIKNKKLTDNTTIIIEDNKISSVKPSVSQKGSKNTPMLRTSSTKDSVLAKSVRSPIERPEPGWARPGTSSSVKRPLDSSAKPVSLVAKKRTGGIPRLDKGDKERKSNFTFTGDKTGQASKVIAPKAKKRTGGSSAVYESMKQNSTESKTLHHFDVERVKKPRKEVHHLRKVADEVMFDDNETSHHSHQSSVVAPMKVPSKPTVSHKYKKKAKRGRKKGHTKSQRRQEKIKQQLQAQEIVNDGSDLYNDYDNAPKRSLRIALKASVTDGPNEDSQGDGSGLEDLTTDDMYSPMDSTPIGHKRRGRPSKIAPIQSNSIPAMSHNNILGESSASTSGASNGQVVMKALVNGKWQDVVIGTKLANDNPETVQTPINAIPSSSSSRVEKISKPIGIRKSTGGNKKLASQSVKIPSVSRGGRKGAGRRGRNAKQSADCWRDDRYQYFSDGSKAMGVLDTSSSMYAVSDPVAYKEDSNADYAQSYEDDTVLPFSLSSYMTYHQDESIQATEPEDQGLPVIVSAYHLDSRNDMSSYHDTQDNFTNNVGQMYKEESNNTNQEIEEAEDIDEVPLRDPLAMDDAPQEENIDDDPLGSPESASLPSQPTAVVAPKKGTVQEAKSAISNLRSVLSQITFKR